MTKFINQKEEVIQIQLSSVGKKKYSQGMFNPEYYAFYDDDILYETNAAPSGGFNEIQNATVPRIKDTKQIGVFTNYGFTSGSLDLGIAKYEEVTAANGKYFQPLGKNSPLEDYAPSWSIVNFHQDSVGFSGSLSDGQLLRYVGNFSIPSLTSQVDIVYDSFMANEREMDILIESQNLYLDVLEMNTLFKGNGNYDIEVYRIPDPVQNPDQMIKLKFVNQESPNSNQLLRQEDPNYSPNDLGEDDEELSRRFPKLDESYVEYFLNIRVDTEIIDSPPIRSADLYKAGRPQDPSQICKDRENAVIAGDGRTQVY
jgi:hypothetical protein